MESRFHFVRDSTSSIRSSVKIMLTPLLQKEDIEVTLLPAGHCPGSVMYVLFSILSVSAGRFLCREPTKFSIKTMLVDAVASWVIPAILTELLGLPELTRGQN